MFNILTNDIKNNLIKNYKKRLFVMFLFILNFIFFISFVALIPSYFILKQEKINIEIEAGLIKQKEVEGYNNENIAKTLRSINNDNFFLSNNMSEIYIYDFIKDILVNKKNTIQITEIVFNRKTATTSSINMSGVALTRDALLSFVKDTENLKKVDINLPVSNFAKDKNIEFTFDLDVDL